MPFLSVILPALTFVTAVALTWWLQTKVTHLGYRRALILAAMLYLIGTVAVSALAYRSAEADRTAAIQEIGLARDRIAQSRSKEAVRKVKQAFSQLDQAVSDFQRGYRTPYVQPAAPFDTAPSPDDSEVEQAEARLAELQTSEAAATFTVMVAAILWVTLLLLYFPAN